MKAARKREGGDELAGYSERLVEDIRFAWLLKP